MPHLRFVVLISAISLFGPLVTAQSVDPLQLSASLATVEGDYRSEASGPWNRDSTWSRFRSGAWVRPAAPPDSGAGTITIRSGHTVTITSSVVYDQLIVEIGGCLIVAPNIAHTLSDGPGNDLTIAGTWINRGGTWTILGAAKWLLADSGTFIHQTTSGISTPLTKASLFSGSTFIYRGGPSAVPASSFSGRTYGNLSFDSSGGPWTCTSTGSGALLILGGLSIGPGVKWSTGGFSGNVTVQGATSVGGEWSGTGSGSLGTHSFIGRFEVLQTGKYQLVTTGAKQGAITLQNDFRNDGLISFPRNRDVVFGGSTTQTICGASPTIFSNGFVVANSSGIVLGCPITVDGSLVLSSGDVRTGTNVLTLGIGGSVSEDGSYAVSGTIRSTRLMTRAVNESFGNIGLEIKALGNDPGLTEVIRVTGTPVLLNGKSSIARYFDITPSTNANIDAILRFHYRDSELSALSEAYLSLYRSVIEGAGWLPVGGDLDPAANLVCLDSVYSLSRWTLGEFFPQPTLTIISPSRALPGEEFDALVRGSGFVKLATVFAFSAVGITVGSVNVISASELKVHIKINSDAPIGARDISVTTSGGSAILPGVFFVDQQPNPEPVLSHVWPMTATRSEALTVQLMGSGLTGGVTLVSFGDGIEVLSVTQNAALLDACISVAEGASLGPRDVTATNPLPGGGSSVLRNAFSVVNPMPTLTLASPGEGTLGDSVAVLLSGSGFVAEGPTVSFGDGIIVDSIVVVDRASLRVRLSISPTTRSGPRDVVVTVPSPGGGTATLVDGFCVTNPSPRIVSISPSVCYRGRSAILTLIGKDFVPGISTVSLSDGIRVDSIHSNNCSEMVVGITIARDFALGFTTVTVKNPWPGGGSSSVAHRLEVYNPPPTVKGVVPNRGVLGQTLEVLVTGEDFFDSVSSLALGVDVVVKSSSCESSGTGFRATVAVADTALVGKRSVVVRNCGPGGGEAVLERAFTVEHPVPVLVSVSPVAASMGQTLDVVLVGANLLPARTSIAFGNGVTVNAVRFEGREKLVANITVSPSANIGARSLLVTNPQPGGGTAELRHVFNIEYKPPKLVRISPVEGVKGRNMVVVLDGAEFCEAVTTAEFGAGIAVDSVVVKSRTSMDAYIRIDENAFSGKRDVRVVNSLPGGGADSLVAAFLVRTPPPEIMSVNPDHAERGRQLTVLIKGDRFVGGVTTLSFGPNVTVGEIIVRNRNELQALVEIESSATPGSRTILVTNEDQESGSAVLKDGFQVLSNTLSFVETRLSDVPDHYMFREAYPNPFNPSTRIRFGLPERSRIKLEVFNVLGNLVGKLADEVEIRGYHEINWNAAGLPSGIYIFRLFAQSEESNQKVVASRRVVLIK